jgi:hypothetical protein
LFQTRNTPVTQRNKTGIENADRTRNPAPQRDLAIVAAARVIDLTGVQSADFTHTTDD